VGYDLLAGLLFAALTPLVVVGFVIYWIVTAKDREEHGSFLEGYAKARDLTFLPAEGEWPNRTSPSITWTSERADMRLTILGRETKARTRLVVKPTQALMGELFATPDPDTYAKLLVRERPKGLADRVLDERVRRSILGFCQRDHVTLTYRRGRFFLEWPGREINDARLDAARRVGDDLASAIDDAFRSTATRRAA
jgi:hypothetical protein